MYIGGALTQAGNITINKADPSIVFDTATATDTDYWMGIIEDAGGDDDDVLVIGEGTTPGSNNYLAVNTSGNIGIGTTTPTSKLHVSGAVVGKALTIFDETGDGALLTASAGGTPKVTIQHNGLVDATAGGLASFIKAGTVSDVDFTDAAVDGLLAFDSTNHRLYFREGGTWSYINRTGGFQIPDYEVGNMVVGDYLVPYVDSTMSDGAVHGLYRRFTDAKNELLSDIYGAIASLIARLEGLREKFVTKESHQEKLCVGKEEDEVCLDGAQLRGVLDNIASLNASMSAIIAATQSAELTATPEAEPTATPTVTPEATPTEAPVITEPEPATGSGNVGEPGEATESGITE